MQSQFQYRNNELYCDDVAVSEIVATVGSPVYIYSKTAFVNRYREIRDSFAGVEHITAYSVKTNANLSLMKAVKDEGCGFDIVSGGELYRALLIGADPKKIIYAGVGKTTAEIRAALTAGILMFDVESEAELARIDSVAHELGLIAPVAIRVNPDIDPKTHRNTTTGTAETKFGLDFERTADLVKRMATDYPRVKLRGIHAHLGSPIYKPDPYAQYLDKVRPFLEREGILDRIEYLNIGGGFAIDYKPNQSAVASDYASVIVPRVSAMNKKLILEPGRYISGNSGVLVSEVQYVKNTGPKRFRIVDAGMNDLIRPALYDAFHEIWPLKAQTPPPLLGGTLDDSMPELDIVGPICETTDSFAKARRMPDVKAGDHLVLFSAGAYGASMSSRYNQHPLVAEVTVSGSDYVVSRRRETYRDMIAMERF